VPFYEQWKELFWEKNIGETPGGPSLQPRVGGIGFSIGGFPLNLSNFNQFKFFMVSHGPKS
jgi:hypothetical protein